MIANRIATFFIAIAAFVTTVVAADPTATNYPWNDCQGTYKPYPAPSTATSIPDSLTPVMINHIGRHGARYPSSAKKASHLRRELARIDEEGGGLTPQGKQLLALTDRVIEAASGRWGALSQLGMAEQRGIASRMFKAYRPLFASGRVNAISSYSPRCIMSMYEFVHQLSRLDNNINVTTLSGRVNSPLMRFFDNNPQMSEYLESERLETTYKDFEKAAIPTAPLRRIMKADPSVLYDEKEIHDVIKNEWAVLTGLQSMGMSADPTPYFTAEEQNRMWSVNNLNHYLKRSANTLSSIPMDASAPLLENLVTTFDEFIADSTSIAPVQLRFGHAETLMPLLALMKLQGCYYLTNYFDTVGLHWEDFHVVPMAANLQLVLLRSNSGHLYIKAELNEQDVPLISGSKKIYVPWGEARNYLLGCLPFDYGISTN